MTVDNQPRTAKPGTLLSQWWTLGTIALDRRTAGRHTAVAWVIIDRFMQKRGNGRASARYIAQATGMGLRHVVRACRELTEWGYFEQHVGTGTRPTEYTPNWSSVSPMGNAKPDVSSVSPMVHTSVSPMGNASEFSVSPMGNESYLPEPADKPGLQVCRNDDTHAAPSAPPLPALTGGTAEAARDPFEKFWTAYPRKYQKPKARVAWEKLAPDADLAERIIAAASEWATHYEAHPVEKKWIPAPANWLAGERYDEDLPEVYVDAKEAAIARAKANRKGCPAKQTATAEPAANNDNEPTFEWMRGSPRLWPAGRYLGEFIAGDVDRSTGDEEVMMSFRVTSPGEHEGEVFQHRFYTQAFIESAQDEGQRVLAGICLAVGVADIEDTDELLHKPIKAIADGRHVAYLPLPAAEAA